MWKFKWAHKRSPRRRIRGVYDCVTTLERIVDRIGVLHTEMKRLCKEPSEESVIQAKIFEVRVARLLDHAHRVKDIQAAWARG